jgi:hypothetical protein
MAFQEIAVDRARRKKSRGDYDYAQVKNVQPASGFYGVVYVVGFQGAGNAGQQYRQLPQPQCLAKLLGQSE